MAWILIVDDDENQRLLYREMLEAEGHDVLEADSGRAAIEAIDREQLGAVILDVNMPDMDGLDALARIHDRNHRLPIILNTAYAAYREQFVAWIADAYIVKSSNLDELRVAVRDALGGARRPKAAE
jgi:two-component system response regulator (stage 0 sporulation protein F)